MKNVIATLMGCRAADWLSLAAAPTFALMAAVTAILDSGARELVCSMHMSGLSGMVPMYVLMSGFHFTPWLKLVAGWRGGPRAA